MKLTPEIRAYIEDLLSDTNENVHSVSLGFKHVNGVKTNDISICFDVFEKKPLNELLSSEIIPSSLIINNETCLTDVNQREKFSAVACYPSATDPEILRLKGDPELLPIKGGQEIVRFPSGFESESVSYGTLGFCGIDEIDNTIVGVTNAHVAMNNVYIASDRIEAIERLNPNNIVEKTYTEVFESEYHHGLLSFNSLTNNWFYTSPRIKRSLNLRKNGFLNLADATVVFLSPFYPLNYTADNNFTNPDSYQIHKPTTAPDYLSKLPFASTEELNNLLSISPALYSTGRTTGPKGWGATEACQIEIHSIGISLWVDYSGTLVRFTDAIAIRYKDGSQGVIKGGDSGSVVLADINGARKIIGLVFAGNSSLGIVCRIDHIASSLNIRAWTDSYLIDTPPNMAEYTGVPWDGTGSPPTGGRIFKQKVLTVPFSDFRSSENFITVSGVKYYQAGCTTSNSFESLT